METTKITIAIDGFSSCGKSTLAKDLAKELKYIFIDSGAMYRAVTLYALNTNCIQEGIVNQTALIESLNDIELHFELNPTTNSPEILLNGLNVAHEIRTPRVAKVVAKVAEIKEVRKKLVLEQRKIGANGGLVMDGRDIGSVVFPNAELKLFITASIQVRTNRRHAELLSKGIEISKQDVQLNLEERDLIDSERKESPLKQTDDAIVIDNTELTKKEQLNKVLNLVKHSFKVK
ncbi:MAG: (d)CMP kinase [Crocinitomicaceae bacterium]|nr:(d)CMP kinase [Crocinitomicaceae bacterium]MDG1777462.1 (d)CMP kinase [Crocinitomicaceae bacterium]